VMLVNLRIVKQPLNILGNADLAWYFQTAVGVWKNLGWSAIIYIAAMTGIDPELYDAAEVDGAGRFGKIWHVTVPGVLPTYVVLLLLAVGNMLTNSFEQYFVFRNPLVVGRLDTLDIFIYTQGLGASRFAFATAAGMLKSLVSIGLLLFVNYLSKRVRGTSII
jgi:putative aldouronate transport system permease protein